eukprot:1142299-Amphidinium_carterae.1
MGMEMVRLHEVLVKLLDDAHAFGRDKAECPGTRYHIDTGMAFIDRLRLGWMSHKVPTCLRILEEVDSCIDEEVVRNANIAGKSTFVNENGFKLVRSLLELGKCV